MQPLTRSRLDQTSLSTQLAARRAIQTAQFYQTPPCGPRGPVQYTRSHFIRTKLVRSQSDQRRVWPSLCDPAAIHRITHKKGLWPGVGARVQGPEVYLPPPH